MKRRRPDVSSLKTAENANYRRPARMRKPSASWIRRLALGLAALAAAGPAGAQLLGGGLGSGLGSALGGVTRAAPGALDEAPPTRALPKATAAVDDLAQDLAARAGAALSEARRLAAQRLIREHPEAVEADDQGAPVVR